MRYFTRTSPLQLMLPQILQFVMLPFVLMFARDAAAGNLADTPQCSYQLAKTQKWPGLSVGIKLPCNWVVDTGYSASHFAVITGVLKKATVLVSTVSFTPAQNVLNVEAIDFLLSDEELRSATRHSGSHLGFKRLVIDGCKAGEVTLKAQNEVKGTTIYSYKLYYYIYSKEGTVLLTFTVQNQKESASKKEFFENLELLRMIASNMSVQW